MLCLKERSPQKKEHSNSKFKEENSSRFYSHGLQRVVARKVYFIAFFLYFFLGGDGSVVVAGYLTRSYQSYVAGWVCTDRGVRDL